LPSRMYGSDGDPPDEHAASAKSERRLI